MNAENTDAEITVRPIAATDYPAWSVLFGAYRDFYELKPDRDVIERVWSWIGDAANEVNALVALHGTSVVGIAHYRAFSRPSAGVTGLYLDDLFTDETVRGRGIGRALIERLSDLAAAEGHSVLRWMTSERNTTARILYDRVATQTQWVTYERKAGALSPDAEQIA